MYEAEVPVIFDFEEPSPAGVGQCVSEIVRVEPDDFGEEVVSSSPPEDRGDVEDNARRGRQLGEPAPKEREGSRREGNPFRARGIHFPSPGAGPKGPSVQESAQHLENAERSVVGERPDATDQVSVDVRHAEMRSDECRDLRDTEGTQLEVEHTPPIADCEPLERRYADPGAKGRQDHDWRFAKALNDAEKHLTAHGIHPLDVIDAHEERPSALGEPDE